MSTIQIVGAAILVVSVLAGAGMRVWSWYKARPKNVYAPIGTMPPAASSDSPAPKGVGEYLTLIERVAGSAPFQVWWGYAKDGLTEAAVLRAEVQRLTPKPPAVPAETKS